MRSRISSMGLIESASERYPTRAFVEDDGGVPNMSSIFFSISYAQIIAAWYCICSSSEEFKRVPNEATTCLIEVSQNGALGP